MRILILGAGAIGGYFGARLLQAGRDVTYLVRIGRAKELAERGLVVKSPRGDARINNPRTVLAQEVRTPFDLILLCCKAYDLANAIESIRSAVGRHTAVLPLLNGIRHLSVLSDAFGPTQVLGGQCVIATQVNSDGVIVQFNDRQSFSFGEQDGGTSERARAIAAELDVANVEALLSETILLDMWEKWVMLATMAAMTCLMRAPIGDILATPRGKDWIRDTFEECRQIAEGQGYPLGSNYIERTLTGLLTPGSSLTASMLRDIENGGRVEADHILGDLIRRRQPIALAAHCSSLLEVAYSHVKAYELRLAQAKTGR